MEEVNWEKMHSHYCHIDIFSRKTKGLTLLGEICESMQFNEIQFC